MTDPDRNLLTDAEINELLAERDIRRQQRSSRERLAHLNAKALAQDAQPPTALIGGLLTTATFGPVGGKKKSLKSYTAHILAVAVASGKPAFNYEPWQVPFAKPVLIFCGEGGTNALKRRHQRIALDVYGIHDVGGLPMDAVLGAARLDEEEFHDKLHEVVWAMEREYGQPPGLVIVDSLYNFHPQDLEAGNLYVRGPMLRDFQENVAVLCGEDSTLLLVDHFNKHTTGLDLDDIGWSGMSQWADSWLLMDHREDADVNERRYQLKLEVGSRDGFNGMYHVDIDLGPFNEAAMADERPMKVAVERVTAFAKQAKGDSKWKSDQEILNAIYAMVDSGNYTPTEVYRGIVGVGDKRVKEVVSNEIKNQQLHIVPGPHREGGIEKTRDLLRRRGPLKLVPQPASDAGSDQDRPDDPE